MNIAKILSRLGIIVMAAAILYAVIYGNFRQEGRMLLSIPWGIVSLVDLYTGFFLFAGWIAYREPSRLRAVVWIVLLLSLGFLSGSLYVFIALHASQGSWGKFWMGTHWTKDNILESG
jgi:hypothetical protein